MPWSFWLILVLGSLLVGSPPSLQAAEPLPLPPGLAAPASATAMPTFELPDPQGEALRSATLQGKVVVVRFWATW